MLRMPKADCEGFRSSRSTRPSDAFHIQLNRRLGFLPNLIFCVVVESGVGGGPLCVISTVRAIGVGHFGASRMTS